MLFHVIDLIGDILLLIHKVELIGLLDLLSHYLGQVNLRKVDLDLLGGHVGNAQRAAQSLIKVAGEAVEVLNFVPGLNEGHVSDQARNLGQLRRLGLFNHQVQQLFDDRVVGVDLQDLLVRSRQCLHLVGLRVEDARHVCRVRVFRRHHDSRVSCQPLRHLDLQFMPGLRFC